MNSKVFVVLAVALLTASGIGAQTTGTIEGTVVDESKAPLPGVMIAVTSPSLQDSKIAVSDPNGRFRFVFLPSGEYKLAFNLSGFANLEQTNMLLVGGRTVTLQVLMKNASEQVLVTTSGAPGIDVRSTAIGHYIMSRQFRALPLGRDYPSIVLTAPGTVASNDGPMVYGSWAQENTFYVDGVNTTGIAHGGVGKALIPEFIEEVGVKSGAYNAEFGRSSGGLINVVTRSGGNQAHGDFFGYMEKNKFQAPRSKAQAKLFTDSSNATRETNFSRNDYGLGFGGYFIKDSMWYFLGFDRANGKSTSKVTSKDLTKIGGPAEGTKLVQDSSATIWTAKVTARAADNHTFIFSAFADPRNRLGAFGDLSGPSSSYMQTISQGSTDAVVRYEGVLGPSLVASFQWSKHAERNLVDGPGSKTPSLLDSTTALYNSSGITLRTGGLGTFRRDRLSREAFRADFAYFLGDFGGDHEIKAGFDYEKAFAQARKYYSGGQLVRKLCADGKMPKHNEGENWRPCPPEWIYYQHETFIRNHPLGNILTGDISYYLQNPYVVNSRSASLAYYAQDNWRLTHSLTINAGLRFDRQRLYDTHGSTSIKLKNELSPRLGLVWDFKGDGTTKLFGSYGSFRETQPLALTINSFGLQMIALLNSGKASPVQCDPKYNGGTGGFPACTIKETGVTHVVANAKGQRTLEYVVGGEMELSRNVSLGAKYLHRKLTHVLADGLNDSNVYSIGNPGYPGMKLVFDESQTHSYPAVKPFRLFRGIELTADKRFANNWQLFASYLYSKLEGNYDVINRQTTPDQSTVPSFDYAELHVNGQGYLSNDRRHQLHIFGSYQFKSGINFGVHTYYRTGVPITAYGYDSNYRDWVLKLSKRGSWDRTGNEYRTDLNISLPIKFKGGAFNLLLDFFNLFNNQQETGRDQRYTTATQALGTIDAQGTIQPAITSSTPCGSLTMPGNCNPSFNNANAWQNPRLLRLGFRITF